MLRGPWLLLAFLLWPGTPANLGVAADRPVDAATEAQYWQRQREQQQATNRHLAAVEQQTRDHVKGLVEQVADAGSTYQAEIIIAEDGPPPPPPPPPFLRRHSTQAGLVVVGGAFVLLAALVVRRLRREAEIRALVGGYLSDGTEVASYKLPEWFAPSPPVAEPVADVSETAPESESVAVLPNPAGEFFQRAGERLAELRAAFKELAGAAGPEAAQPAVLRAHALVCGLREQASIWELRPAWQMCSALELLLKRLADKPKDVTPSVTRTLAAALDVLHEVCVPGVRPNLLNDPPLRILAVDDEPLCRKALQFALEKASFATDLAETGERAVELAGTTTYDVVFMDIQMPGIDGLTACERIHEIRRNATVPVVFVTVQSDFNTRAQLRLKGGADLMAKPFLVFELTVRAMTFAMRRRLEAAVVNRREEAAASAAVPAQFATPILQPGWAPVAEPPAIPSAPSPGQIAPDDDGKSGVVAAVDAAELAGDFMAQAPQFLADTVALVEALQKADDGGPLEESLGAIYLRIHALASKAGLAGMPIAAHVSATLESLIKRLYRNPKTVTASTLNTVANALRLLESICHPGIEAKLSRHGPVRILVADDEPLARRAVVGALQLAFKQPESAEDGAQAAGMVAATPYDVIFTDVQMPGLDGFELCAAVRASEANARTPVIFITSHTEIEAQTRALSSGGNDFIGKPFLPIEITVKALTFAWDGRLNRCSQPAALAAA